MYYFFQKWLWRSSYTKNHVVLSKCDNVIDKNSHFGLKLCTNVKNKYQKGIFDHFFFFKKSLNLQKIENHVATFPFWF
jgi:hypothetical protein